MRLLNIVSLEDKKNILALHKGLKGPLQFKDLRRNEGFTVEGSSSVFLKKGEAYSINKKRDTALVCAPTTLVTRAKTYYGAPT